ncbi:MAG TPA: ABC transporter permease [bacterium]|nr:ABC transporter permease [bacterium]
MSYVLRRLERMVLTIAGVITFAFLLIHLTPGDPAALVLGDYVTPDALRQVRAQLELDKPLAVQYARYASRVLHGDLGHSFRTDQPVLDEIRSQAPFTAMLTAAGIVLALAIGVPIGTLAAIRRNSLADYAATTVAMLSLSTPGFWFAILLIYVFAYRLGLFPVIGAGRWGDWHAILTHLALPAVAIGARSAALVARMTRSSMLDVLHQDYIRTGRAKGLSGRAVVLKHALRNAAIPIVTIVGLDVAYLLGGAVVTETVFARPGLGKLLVDAIYARDYPTIQGAIMIFAFSLVVINLLVDLSYACLDPRIRYQ